MENLTQRMIGLGKVQILKDRGPWLPKKVIFTGTAKQVAIMLNTLQMPLEKPIVIKIEKNE